MQVNEDEQVWNDVAYSRVKGENGHKHKTTKYRSPLNLLVNMAKVGAEQHFHTLCCVNKILSLLIFANRDQHNQGTEGLCNED